MADTSRPVPAESRASSQQNRTSTKTAPEQNVTASPDAQDFEKPPFLYTTEAGSEYEDGFDDSDPRIQDIPSYVRRVVSFSDDPTLPTLTFRYFLLTVVFVVPGAFLSMMSHYRTTYAPYSIFFVQIASSYTGDWLAKVLPTRQIRFPFTTWSFSLNPGPFSVKEHVLITISAASGATYNMAYTPISMAELYFDTKMHPLVAIFFMWVSDTTVSVSLAQTPANLLCLLKVDRFYWVCLRGNRTAILDIRSSVSLVYSVSL